MLDVIEDYGKFVVENNEMLLPAPIHSYCIGISNVDVTEASIWLELHEL